MNFVKGSYQKINFFSTFLCQPQKTRTPSIYCTHPQKPRMKKLYLGVPVGGSMDPSGRPSLTWQKELIHKQ